VVPYQGTITIQLSKEATPTNYAHMHETYSVHVYACSPYTEKTSFDWLVNTMLHHIWRIGVNTTGMWRTMASYVSWAFQQYPEWGNAQFTIETWFKYSNHPV